MFDTYQTSMAEDAFTPPLIPEWIEVSNMLWPRLQAAIVGDMTSQEALDEAARKRRCSSWKTPATAKDDAGAAGPAAAPPPSDRADTVIRYLRTRQAAMTPFLLLSPAILTMLFVVAIPLVFSFYTSLTPYRLTRPRASRPSSAFATTSG